MTDYQAHVAEKAKQLLKLMEKAATQDEAVAKLLRAMRADLDRIAQGIELLPSRILHGWIYYFTSENTDRIDEKYPKIVTCEAELSSMMSHDSMEGYLKYMAYLQSL